MADVFADWFLREPPPLEGGWASLWPGLRLGRGIASLSPEHRHRLLQLIMSPLGPLLDRYFESEILKIKLAAGAIGSPRETRAQRAYAHSHRLAALKRRRRSKVRTSAFALPPPRAMPRRGGLRRCV